MSTTLNTLKEQAQTSQPLLLAAFVWADGFTVYLSTHNLSAISGGYPYGGQNYLPRLLNQNLTAVQALSDQGISLTPTVTLRMADADAYLYNNIEAPRGFKGAVVTLTLVMIDMTTGTASSDSTIKFGGVSGPAQLDDKTLTVTAVNKINLATQNLPKLKLQPFCPWIFPTTPALQQAAASGTNQQSKECPYNPAGTSNQLGNLNPATGTPYTSCGKVKGDCVARGMYSIDNASRQTGTFGGIQYNPPSSVLSRKYAGHWEQVFNTSNLAKYNDLVPLMYGEGWMQNGCMTLNQSNDANYTSMEILVCYGLVDLIFMVVVNGVEIPHVGPGTDSIFPNVAAGVSSTKDALRIGYWAGVNNGSIKGRPNAFAGYNSLGDPYGSLCVLFITVVNSIASPGQAADVQVLFRGAGTRVYSSTSAYAAQYTATPPWHVMDALTWLNLEYEELDIQSFINEAAYCDYDISYISPFGVSASHPRFAFSLAMRQRLDGASAIRQMLNGFRALLIPNYATGLLRLLIKKTLADQQPAPVDGSNDNTPVASYNSAAAAATGYFAYHFGASSIAEDSQGNTTLKVTQEQMQAAPNEVSFQFQDSENTFSSDSIQIDLDDDIALTGAVMPGSLQIAGPNTYDHGQRIIASWFGEHLRGNGRLAADGETIGDTGGTLSFYFETSVKAAKLQVGQIIALDAPKYNLVAQPLRIRQIAPTSNFERVAITADWHNDAWYFDFYGQTGAPLWTSGYKSVNPSRVSALTGGAAPLLLDTPDDVFAEATAGACLTEMGLAPVQYSTAGGASTARLVLRVAPPTNVFDGALPTPFVPVQAATASTGGALAGGYTYYVAFQPKSASGQGLLSAIARVYVPAGTSTNTVTVTNLFWGAATTGFNVFAGIAPDQLFLQAANYSSTGPSGQPASVTLTGLLRQLGFPPDPILSLICLRAKLEYFPGIFTALLTSAGFAGGSWTLGLPVVVTGFASNALVGRKVALLGRASASEADVYNTSLTITASGGASITVRGDLLGLAAFEAGDQITVRLAPTIGTDSTGNYIDDALFVNPYRTAGLVSVAVSGWVSVGASTISSLAGLLVRIVAGTGEGTTATIASNTATRVYIAGNWVIAPDATSVFVIEHNAWFASNNTSPISNNGTMGVIPSTIDASPYLGQCVLIEAVSVDVNGNQGPELGTPVREVYLLGSGGGGDTGDPPQFGFSLSTDFRGNFVLFSVGPPAGSTNYSTAENGTLELFTWDMDKLSTGADWTLAAALTSSAGTISVTAALSATGQTPYFGQLLMIGSELVAVLSVSGTVFSVGRGANNSNTAAHTAGAGVFALDLSVFQVSFPPLFFTQANSADFEQTFGLPNTLVASATFAVTNSVGAGQATVQCYTATAGYGAAATSFGIAAMPQAGYLSGIGGIADTFGIAGILAIGSNLATPYQRDTITQPRQIVAQVRLAPTGSIITLNINAGGALYASLSIASGAVVAVLTGPLPPVPINVPLTIDVVAVGVTYPGSDLGVTIFG